MLRVDPSSESDSNPEIETAELIVDSVSRDMILLSAISMLRRWWLGLAPMDNHAVVASVCAYGHVGVSHAW